MSAEVLSKSGEIHAGMPLMAHVAFIIANFLNHETTDSVVTVSEYDPCGKNISCKIDAIVDHKPLQDADGDYYSSVVKTLRGTDWRGVDCDDTRNDVYPGRRTVPEGYEGDHNCNGIVGANATGRYEDLFCAKYPARGLIMLGDSATAHFHIPPQWITAAGWGIENLLGVAENELDYPMCSWGTGHAQPEECPYQHPVDGLSGVTSLYTLMRERNRCNHNDYQNIGVNGAKVVTSMGLVEAMARIPEKDSPALVWMPLIGNDVCNGHPGFGSMSTPEEFYEKAMASFRALDKVLPPGSHVVSLALFDGEMLYQIMHSHQHPIGNTYDDIYNFMNCLEENPCWGWLNDNATVRQMTTQWSNSLNNVYRNISHTQKFNNFEYIFYAPVWTAVFADYQRAGHPLTDLIEPADGFHPSQTGNAIFAQKFFAWLEENHPQALGPINPHNAEIDALFFNKNKK